ncbi:GTPase HflX [Anaerobacillus sp. MEB173]|uniref:GTPase HflX n=1 Tax=Anaerobacillus sp. MEB173 TaxID=3383345 RepID=UPI003F9060AE
MSKNIRENEERVLLVGCHLYEDDDERFTYSMEELDSLTKTAQGKVVMTVTQKRKKYDPATYIGKGKVEEIATLEKELEVDVIIFNDELTSSQVRNLSRYFEAKVIDRTQLILDIFSSRAQSKEGKLQVEWAQLSYLLPRLTGQGLALSRLGGGIGTRGPGETQLETDRRHIRKRMDEIKEQLQTIVNHRERYRKRRKENRTLQIALVGYTNAGKSTLLNRLTEADTFEEDLLFATLDPTTRKLKLPSGLTVLLTDTVGFIQDLPTTLIAAFRSTLEEVKEADLILHVVDGSHEGYYGHEQTVTSLLKELDVAQIPLLTVYNKRDQMTPDFVPTEGTNSIVISAFNNDDLRKLCKTIESLLINQMDFYHVYIQSEDGKFISQCQSQTIITERKWNNDKEVYEYKGYVHPSLAIAGKLLENRK